jgi:hypothetical protein
MLLEGRRMPWRFSLIAVSSFVLLVLFSASPAAMAQGPDVFVTPIPNAPFSAVIHVDRSFVQNDGSIIARKTVRSIARDSRGRIRNEYRTLLPVESAQTPQVLSVLIYDPQTRTSTTLFPQQQIFRSGSVSRPPETVPPGLLGRGTPANDFAKEEDLGIHDTGGVMAHGIREIQTIPADQSGTGKEIVITDEFWYSDDLRINVLIKHNDPRTGSLTMTVSQVNRNEPDPVLFVIPEGFKPPAPRPEPGK